MKGIITNKWVQGFAAIVFVAGTYAYVTGTEADVADVTSAEVNAETENTISEKNENNNTEISTTSTSNDNSVTESVDDKNITVIKDEGKLEIINNEN